MTPAERRVLARRRTVAGIVRCAAVVVRLLQDLYLRGLLDGAMLATGSTGATGYGGWRAWIRHNWRRF